MLAFDLEKMEDIKIIQNIIRGGLKRKVYYIDQLGIAWLENITNDLNYLNQYTKEYRENYYNESKKQISSNHLNMSFRQNSRLELIKPFLEDNHSLMEIGCSSGYFLEQVGEDYLRVGIELNREEVAYGKELGLDIRQGDLSSVNSGEKFNHVCAFQVLEHQPDPETFLKDLSKLIKDEGGYLHIEIPTLDNPLISLYEIDEFRKFWFQEPHLYYFSKRFIPYLSNRIGLKLQKITILQTTTLYNHLHWIQEKKPMKDRSLCELEIPKFELSNISNQEGRLFDKKNNQIELENFFKDKNSKYCKMLSNKGYGDILFFTLRVN